MVLRRPSWLSCLAELSGSLARRSCIVCFPLCSLFVSGGVPFAPVSCECLSFCFFPPFLQWSCRSFLFRLGQELCSWFERRREAHTRLKEQGPCGHRKFSGARKKVCNVLVEGNTRGLHVAKSIAHCWAAAPDQRGSRLHCPRGNTAGRTRGRDCWGVGAVSGLPKLQTFAPPLAANPLARMTVVVVVTSDSDACVACSFRPKK